MPSNKAQRLCRISIGGTKSKMEIRINDQKIDFRLEDEDTLGEVVHGLEEWLKGTDSIVTSVRHGQKDLYTAPEGEWESTPVEQIDLLDVTVQRWRELRISNLETVHEFFRLLLQALTDDDYDRMQELLDGYELVHESLKVLFCAHTDFQELDALLRGPTVVGVKGWPLETRARVQSLVERTDASVVSFMSETKDPVAALAKLRNALKGSITEISEVSVLLQTGKDRQAMEHVIRFSDRVQSLLRVLGSLGDSLAIDFESLTIADNSTRDFFASLIAMLRELLQAFQANDSVLIGDLLEYEIAPRLEALVQHMGELEQMAHST